LFNLLSDEVLLTLGMMADALFHMSQFVKECDESALDEAELPQMVQNFQSVMNKDDFASFALSPFWRFGRPCSTPPLSS